MKRPYYVINGKRLYYDRDEHQCIICPHCREVVGYNFGNLRRHLEAKHAAA